MVGKDYEVVQNIDAFSFFDAIVGDDGIQYETACALGKGERIFITAKLPNYIKWITMTHALYQTLLPSDDFRDGKYVIHLVTPNR